MRCIIFRPVTRIKKTQSIEQKAGKEKNRQKRKVYGKDSKT